MLPLGDLPALCVSVVSLLGTFTAIGSAHFFFNDPAAAEIYTLSLHDALPILAIAQRNRHLAGVLLVSLDRFKKINDTLDRKSTRLNSSHEWISYAVFCLT